MASDLCGVCRSISPGIWGSGFPDHMVPVNMTQVNIKLQSFKSMEKASGKGCRLCNMFVSVLWSRGERPKDTNICLLLHRFASSENEIRIVPEKYSDDYATGFLPMYPYLVPHPWTKHSPAQVNAPVDNIRIMKTWMEECRSTHTTCSLPRTREPFLPTRLLDVHAFTSGQDIRLVSSREIPRSPRPEYLTLSHCWGEAKTHSIKLIKENTKDLMTRIPNSYLSNTFRDAVKTTRDLGFRYIWIDSLCIVQNSEKDWAKEASLMAEVYGNAFCTLAALSSRDSTGGFSNVPEIQKATRTYHFEIESGRPDYPRVRIFSRRPLRWQAEYEGVPEPASRSPPGTILRTRTDSLSKDYKASSSPLRFRAWVLQERELSRRTIHFAKTQILWECQHKKATAQLPWQEESSANPVRDPWLMRCEPTRHEVEALRHRERWYKLVEDYTSRQLSFQSDKLPALAGLAKANHHCFPGATYIAGLWTSHLPAALLWQTAAGAAKRHGSQPYVAPSWSWASLQGCVSYDSQRLAPSSTWGDRNLDTETFTGYYRLSFEKVASRPRHDDPYSAITDAYLVLRGAQLVSVDHPPRPRSAAPGGRVDMAGEPLTRRGAQVGVLFRDSVDDDLSVGELFYLPVRPEDPSWSLQHNQFQGLLAAKSMGLVLIRLATNVYARVGLGRWVLQSTFADVRPPGTIKLV